MCQNCGKPLTGRWQKKYCSRSCSASTNNIRKDINRRLPENKCKLCDKPISTRWRYCLDCRLIVRPGSRGGAKGKTKNRRNYIATQARKIYLRTNPVTCVICGYDKHIDVCHIVDVSRFPEGTSYAVINNKVNLIGLCPNHHWEFDHDLL